MQTFLRSTTYSKVSKCLSKQLVINSFQQLQSNQLRAFSKSQLDHLIYDETNRLASSGIVTTEISHNIVPSSEIPTKPLTNDHQTLTFHPKITAWNLLLHKGLDGNLNSIPASTPLRAVVELFMELRTGCLIVVSDTNPQEVVGLICERDVILAYEAYSSVANSSTISPQPQQLHDGTIRSGGFIPLRHRGRDWPALAQGGLWDSAAAKEAMTPANRIIFGNAVDSCALLLSITTRAGFRHLPILKRISVDEDSTINGVSRSRRVEKSYLVGLLTIHDLVEGLLASNKDMEPFFIDSKKQFIRDIMPRRGFPANTQVYINETNNLPSPLYLETASYNKCHPNKIESGGEDAYFTATYLPTEENYFTQIYYSIAAVSDGVSSWQYEAKVDAGLFSRRLLSTSSELIAERIDAMVVQESRRLLEIEALEIENKNNLKGDILGKINNTNENDGSSSLDLNKIQPPSVSFPISMNTKEVQLPTPRELVDRAWQTVRKEHVIGSATLCIGVLNATYSPKSPHSGHTFNVINIGDSGFVVLRPISDKNMNSNIDTSDGPVTELNTGVLVTKYSIVYKSLPQLIEFDCPAQLGVDVTDEPGRFQTPSDANEINFNVKENDIIILATDGLFDNLYDEDIIEMANLAEAECFAVSSGMSLALPEVIAQYVGNLAYERSLNRKFDSPFAAIAKENMIMWSGGRKDDITVTVSRVKRGQNRRPITYTSSILQK